MKIKVELFLIVSFFAVKTRYRDNEHIKIRNIVVWLSCKLCWYTPKFMNLVFFEHMTGGSFVGVIGCFFFSDWWIKARLKKNAMQELSGSNVKDSCTSNTDQRANGPIKNAVIIHIGSWKGCNSSMGYVLLLFSKCHQWGSFLTFTL